MGIILVLLLSQFSVQDRGVSKGSTGGVNCSGRGVSCKIQNGKWQLSISATCPTCTRCDAGYVIQTDGGCDTYCHPDLGQYNDGGCVRTCGTAALELCDALLSMDGGRVGDWWCLRGDQTMLAGSSINLYGVNGDGGPFPSPVTRQKTVCTQEAMTPLNDTGATTNWGQFFTSDGGSDSPDASFTTMMVFENEIRNLSAITSYTNGMVRFGQANPPKWSHDEVAGPFTFPGGDTATCSPSCGQSTKSGLGVPRRAFGVHFATFHSSVDGGTTNGITKVCNYFPGNGGGDGGSLTCSAVAHGAVKITPTRSSWYVGYGSGAAVPTGSGQDMADGFMAGAAKTDRDLTEAEMLLLGLAILPPTPATRGFTRATDKTCCGTTSQCLTLPPNNQCSIGAQLETYVEQTNNTAGTPEAQLTNVSAGTRIDGGSMNPNVVLEHAISPWGFTTAHRYSLGETRLIDAGTGACWGLACGSGNFYSESGVQGCSSGITGTVTCQWMVKSATSATLDMCIANTVMNFPSIPQGQQCGTCSVSSDWTLCSYTGLSTGSTSACEIGNLTKTAPTNSCVQGAQAGGCTYNGKVERPEQTVWIVMPQCNYLSTRNDFSFLGTSTARSPEVCSGVGCP